MVEDEEVPLPPGWRAAYIERARKVAAAGGFDVEEDAAVALWSQVEGCNIKRTLNEAAAIKGQGELAKGLASVESRTTRLLATLRHDEVSQRLGVRITGEVALGQLIEGLAELVIAARAERLSVEAADRASSSAGAKADLKALGFERPKEACYRELGALARAGGAESETAVIAFTRAVFREWGEAEPTSEAIRSGIHRTGRSTS